MLQHQWHQINKQQDFDPSRKWSFRHDFNKTKGSKTSLILYPNLQEKLIPVNVHLIQTGANKCNWTKIKIFVRQWIETIHYFKSFLLVHNEKKILYSIFDWNNKAIFVDSIIYILKEIVKVYLAWFNSKSRPSGNYCLNVNLALIS